MSSSIPAISALHCVKSDASQITKALTNWTIESIDRTHTLEAHPHFDATTGVYTAPKDGLYLLHVQLIPIGGATLRNALQTRKRVNYALRIQDPRTADEYVDIGTHNLGQMKHLRAGSLLTCMRMAGAPGTECVRMNICCVQRKRKREEKVYSKKEIKRMRRAAGRAVRVERDGSDDDVEDSSDSEWEHGFDSDSTSDELPTSNRNVGRLAKRLKTCDAE